MKHTPLLFILALILGSASDSMEPTGKKLIKDYVFIPSGNEGSALLPGYYISSIEITNKQYREFINELAASGESEKLKLAMVDSAQWAQVEKPCGPFMGYYFRHPAYNDYPVVNVSRRGAELYCEWLTDKYNRTAKQKVRFSLPTEQQWIHAARGSDPQAVYPWPGNSLTWDKKGKWQGTKRCNYLVENKTAAGQKQSDHIDITSPSHSFIPNKYDLYNMSGNVAEMVADGNFTKGGSYLSHADKLQIAAREEADLSHGSPAIGFRPVMVIVH